MSECTPDIMNAAKEISGFDTNYHDCTDCIAAIIQSVVDKELAALRAQVEEWELIKKAFLEEYNLRNKGLTRNISDYHYHGHDVSGVWDRDNGSLAGKKCAACMAMRAALAATGNIEKNE